MKVPFTANQSHQSANAKPVNCNNTIRNNTNSSTANLCYEPKSVLELRGSPSPGTDKPAAKTEISAVCDDLVQPEDHVLNQFEDWDSFMKEFGLHEDNISNSKPSGQLTQYEFQTQYASLPELSLNQSFDSTQFTPLEFTLSDTSQFPLLNHSNINPFDISNDIHHMNNNWNVGFDYVDELIRFAECFETHSFQLAHVILGRLNQRLRSASGKPLQRAAFYFKEALQTLLTGSSRPLTSSSSSDVIQTIKAQNAFSNISPIPMFSSFTANQAVLEAVDCSTLVHIIDFDIGFGGHWASFIKELADKAESRKATALYLRITALVHEEYAVESKLIRENLTQFARELNIAFDIDFVLFRTFEYLSFKAIKFMEGEKVIVLLSPVIFRRVGTGFVNDLRRVSPHVVVHVDSEGLMGFGTTSFRQTVIDGLEFYSTLLESLEAANACAGGGGGGGGDWMRRIETFVLFPKITEAVEAAGLRGTPWREAFVAAGFRPVGLSQFADCQADCLLRRVQVRGFHVAKRQAEMLLCWHERALVATSAWRC